MLEATYRQPHMYIQMTVRNFIDPFVLHVELVLEDGTPFRITISSVLKQSSVIDSLFL